MDYESPDSWGDENLFLVAFHRDFSVDVKGFEREVCIALNDKDEREGYEERVKEIQKKYHVFGLEAYIHSGVKLSLSQEGNFPDRRWDVSQLGEVFVAKSEARTRKGAHKLALCLLSTWNACLDGIVYGFIVKKGEKEESCWGFIETEYPIEKTDVLKEARSVADSLFEEEKKEQGEKRKAYIKNHVPLSSRKPSTLTL